jgi:hypothetical protein
MNHLSPVFKTCDSLSHSAAHEYDISERILTLKWLKPGLLPGLQWLFDSILIPQRE